ncbi:MAG: flagellar biosynthesis protein [Chloroflexi bacterium]|nr:flagellar biosynthesis protein [Chloroflexota bacterium]
MERPLDPVRATTWAAPQVGPARQGRRPSGGSFAAVLAGAEASQRGVELSSHAARRILQRELPLDARALERLGRAMDRAQSKGVRSPLILLDGMAVVANVAHRRIVTAMETGQAREQVFTNIDGVVFA